MGNAKQYTWFVGKSCRFKNVLHTFLEKTALLAIQTQKLTVMLCGTHYGRHSLHIICPIFLLFQPATELSKSPQAPGSAGNVNHRSELPGWWVSSSFIQIFQTLSSFRSVLSRPPSCFCTHWVCLRVLFDSQWDIYYWSFELGILSPRCFCSSTGGAWHL